MVIDFIKVACRQSKEGYSVTISIPMPPNEASDVKPFIDEFLGSKWTARIMPATEGGDNETVPTTGHEMIMDDSEPAPPVTPTGQARAFRPLTLPQRVALQCQDELFQRFLIVEGKARDKADVPDAVRAYCGVKSRSEILPGSYPAEKWDRLMSRYVAWQHDLPMECYR